MEHEFKNISIPSKAEPKSTDIDRDRKFLLSILDDIANGVEPIDIIFRYSTNITEWISWQLGLYVEFHKFNINEKIIDYGITAIYTADYGRWIERQGANRNSLAGYLIQLEQYDLAKKLCEKALNIATPYFEAVYASSLSLLAAIEMFNRNYLKATYYFDALFRVLKSQGLESEIKIFAETAELAYKKGNDVAGSFYIESLLKSEEESYNLWKQIYPEYLKNIDLGDAIIIYTKFISYGLYEFAQPIKATFYDNRIL